MCRAIGVARPRLAISTLRLAESFLRFMPNASRQRTTTNWRHKRSRSPWVIVVGEDRPFSTTTCSSDGDVFTYLLTKIRGRKSFCCKKRSLPLCFDADARSAVGHSLSIFFCFIAFSIWRWWMGEGFAKQKTVHGIRRFSFRQ